MKENKMKDKLDLKYWMKIFFKKLEKLFCEGGKYIFI